MPPGFYTQPVLDLARALIGCTLTIEGVGGMIVETEAYHAGDPASHSHAGPTSRNRAMWGPAGYAYIYRIYGIHWCLNVVGGDEPGAAVLIRALQPTHGLDRMRARRGITDERALCSGPGKLCQALGITGALDGHTLAAAPFALTPGEPLPTVTGPRIGISKAADEPWRFGVAGSRFLSRPFPPPNVQPA
ncbi:MAG: 3-methyladenine glycosylase [Sphingomonas bacterium]|uniref:DNA-3-methyladenine glycosylase n=1 Tax=Sphingomonas bacterium TaxID=1895847 RepID=UPI002633C886|nr:DNA-3-methyladenine glycosylase [Sphingomonas bacterium]MDB5696463.1 3-methyladenine glycosylase [Sphingomonas bacterium]